MSKKEGVVCTITFDPSSSLSTHTAYISPSSLVSLNFPCFGHVILRLPQLPVMDCDHKILRIIKNSVFVTLTPDTSIKEGELCLHSWLSPNSRTPETDADKICVTLAKVAQGDLKRRVTFVKVRHLSSVHADKRIPSPLPPNFISSLLTRCMNGLCVKVGCLFSVCMFGRLLVFEVLEMNTLLPQLMEVSPSSSPLSSPSSSRSRSRLRPDESTPSPSKSPKSTTKPVSTSLEQFSSPHIGMVDVNTQFHVVESQKRLKTQLHGLTEQIKQVRDYSSAPGGVLICGVAGVGKTTFVRHLFNGNQVIHTSGCALEGVTDKSQALPSLHTLSIGTIIVVDGIEAIKSRATALYVANVLDSCAQFGICVVGVTNDITLLDPLLNRAGRFDKVISLPVPDEESRVSLIKSLLTGVPCDSELPNRVAQVTHGYVPRDLARLCRTACLNCKISAKHSVPLLIYDHFVIALESIGPSQLIEYQDFKGSPVTFDLIGGYPEVKRRIQEHIEWPQRYKDTCKRLGISTNNNGVLLHGPSGCGKTMLARAATTAAGVNRLYVKGPLLLSKWVGETERKLRHLFKCAREAAPCVLVFDEIDALGLSRSYAGAADAEGGVGVRLLSQLLTELDGITALGGITVIGCTSRLDLLDSALVRPGRLAPIKVPLPAATDRDSILQVVLKGMKASHNIDCAHIAAKTEGWTGAKLARLCSDAGLIALRENIQCKEFAQKHLEQALNSFVSHAPSDK